jgi:hypothetical protein
MKNKNRLNYFFLLFLCGVLLLLVGSLVWNMYRGNRSFAESAEERAEQAEGALCTVSDEAEPTQCNAGEIKAPSGEKHVLSAQEKHSRHLELLDIIHGKAPAAPVAEIRPTPPPAAAAPEGNNGWQQGWVNHEEAAQEKQPADDLDGSKVPELPPSAKGLFR